MTAHGLIDAMKTVFTVYGGSVAADGTVVLTGAGQLLGWASALMFIWVLLASGSAWIMGAGRATRPPAWTAPGRERPTRRVAHHRPRHRLVPAGHRLPPLARLGTADPDAALPAGFEGQRLQFELLVLAPLATVVAACTVFHLASRRSG
jgi:hypothetical protein